MVFLIWWTRVITDSLNPPPKLELVPFARNLCCCWFCHMVLPKGPAGPQILPHLLTLDPNSMGYRSNCGPWMTVIFSYLEKILQCGRETSGCLENLSTMRKKNELLSAASVCRCLGSGNNWWLKKGITSVGDSHWQRQDWRSWMAPPELQGPPWSIWSSPLPSGWGKPHQSTCPSMYRYLVRRSGT